MPALTPLLTFSFSTDTIDRTSDMPADAKSTASTAPVAELELLSVGSLAPPNECDDGSP